MRPDPYHVWLSEIMLQQTTVAAVAPYFARFTARFPTVCDLAAAADDEVLGMWAGLGYYARARNLIACARAVAARGGFPASVEGLRQLPGIGAYTASAVAAIAFGVPTVPVDGNVERVAARVFAIEDPLPGAKPLLAAAAADLGAQDAARAAPADFAQGLFDLGATVCTPRAPSCMICPWRGDCAAHVRGIAADLPRRAPKPRRPVRYGTAFLLVDDAGRIGLRRRPPKGLLGGMLELPGSDWASAMPVAEAPVAAAWREAGEIRHVFTHFELRLSVRAACVARLPGDLIAAPTEAALPTVMRKARDAGLRALDAARD